jgi:hypothetical protein
MPDVKTNRFCRNHKKKLVKDLETRIRITDFSASHTSDSDGTLVPGEKSRAFQNFSSGASKRASARWFLAYTLINNPGVSFSYNL